MDKEGYFSELISQLEDDRKKQAENAKRERDACLTQWRKNIGLLIAQSYREITKWFSISSDTPEEILEELRNAKCTVIAVYCESPMTNNDVITSYKVILPK